MNSKTAQKMIDCALQFELMELALQIARTPDDQISAQMPQIAELREIAESIELKRENLNAA